jgi:hypothetical protein
VNLFTEDGEMLGASTLQRSAHPTDLAWHPTEKLLVVA